MGFDGKVEEERAEGISLLDSTAEEHRGSGDAVDDDPGLGSDDQVEDEFDKVWGKVHPEEGSSDRLVRDRVVSFLVIDEVDSSVTVSGLDHVGLRGRSRRSTCLSFPS